MSLRFFGAPAVLGGALLARAAPTLPARATAALLPLAVLVGLLAPGSRWRDDGHYADDWTLEQTLRPRGIADERAFYGPRTRASWVWAHRDVVRERGDPTPPYHRAVDGRAVAGAGYRTAAIDQAGYFSYFAGPGVYVVEHFALADAFVARIPFVLPPSGRWRVGHYERAVPEGYAEMAASGRPAFGDPALDAAFSAVALVTRGPLWAPERWRAIWELHRGAHDAAFAQLARGAEPEAWPVE
jgi:arabinofuranosyltransferase